MAILGIDLGTSNSLCAVWKDGKSELIPNEYGELTTLSAVWMDANGNWRVGKEARERAVTEPENTALRFKPAMGTDQRFCLAGHTYMAEELSSLVLRQLANDARRYLNEEVSDAIISVPAYFNDRQRAATKRAGALAGLQVKRLINEPSAAALAYRNTGVRQSDDGEPEMSIVIDFGGGTLDVSVVECFDNVVNILAVSGDNHLGGSDFDQAIARYFCRQNGLNFDELPPSVQETILLRAERCKKELTQRNSTQMQLHTPRIDGSILLGNQRLIEITPDLLQRFKAPIVRAVSDSGMALDEIDKIVLAGGSCRMPVIQRYVEHILSRSPEPCAAPDTMIAVGAGTYAGIVERDGNIRDLVMTDVCPFTLGVAIMNHEQPSKMLMSPIIERNSVLPCSRESIYSTVRDMQPQLETGIYQGEDRYVENNLHLGQITLPVPPAPAGEQSARVRFTYDISGILEVDVVAVSTGERRQKLIIDPGSELDIEAAEARMRELAPLKVHPRDAVENAFIIARAERLYRETRGEAREQVNRNLATFLHVIEEQDIRMIARIRPKMQAFLNRMEEIGTPALDENPFRFDDTE